MRRSIIGGLLCFAAVFGSSTTTLRAQGATTYIDNRVAEGLAQVAYAHAPGRQLGGGAPATPTFACSDVANKEAQIAARRPTALLSKWIWESDAKKAIYKIDRPIPVCFRQGWGRPDTEGANTVSFNNDYFEERKPSVRYALESVLATSEIPALTDNRVGWVKTLTMTSYQSRLRLEITRAASDVSVARRIIYHPR